MTGRSADPPSTRLRNVRLYDALAFDDAVTTPLRSVVLAGGTILSIDDASPTHSRADRAIDLDLDLDGSWLLPAFVDSHLHLHTMAVQSSVLPIARSIEPERLAAQLVRFEQSPRQGSWLVGQGWSDPLPDRLGPSPREWLDRVVPDLPVWLFATDHHRALLGSVALRECGLDPAGHSGVLLEDAMMDAWSRVPSLPPDFESAFEELSRSGIAAVTSFDGHDGRVTTRAWTDRNPVSMRVRHSIPHDEFLREALFDAEDLGGDHGQSFLVPWVKVFLDGTLGSRTAWLHADYTDAPGNRGDERVSAVDRATLVEAIIPSALSLAIHAIGDAAVAAALDMIEAVEAGRAARGDHAPRAPHRVEHAQLVSPTDLARFARVGAIASMQACHLLEDAAIGPERFGDRCAQLFPIRSLHATGASVILGSDAPIETVDPWVDIDAAVRRVDRAGRFPDGWASEERIDFATAFRMRTAAAAAPNVLPNGWGRIAVGGPADLQVLACDDPTRVRSRAESKITQLFIGGSLAGEWRGS